MVKLFSLESEPEASGGLLIDKVIEKADKDKEGLRVTADLIKQRQKLKVEIDKEIKDTPGEKEGDDAEPDKDSEAKEDDDSEKSEEGSADESGDAADDNSDKSSEQADDKNEGEDSDKESKEDDEEDSTESAQDAGNLESMIGSGLNKDSKEPKGKAKPADDEKGKVSEESLKSIVPFKLFSGVAQKHAMHRIAMEQYNLTPSVGVKAQPVAYVKEEVIESLNKIVVLANRYIARNKVQTLNAHKALLSLSERLTVFQQCHEAKKLHLTLKVIEDKETLKVLSVPGNNNFKDTTALMDKYLGGVCVLTAKVLENDLTALSSSLTSCGYTAVDGLYTYQKTLPGFNTMHVVCTEYEDYLKTKYENYQAYRGQAFKVQELYDLSGISLDKDADLLFVFERLTSMITQTGLITDNLNDLCAKYGGLVEKVKATCYDVQEGKTKDLSGLNIDEHLKDFIRFKVVTELYSTAIDLSVGYVTSVLESFSSLIELDN